MPSRRSVAHRLTRPLRTKPVPVLSGNGRGLRVRFGESDLGALLKGHEPKIEHALLDLVREGDVFYDIGANIGWYSLLGARKTCALVVAFEPMVDNAAILRENAKVNGLPITVIPAAVTDVDGWASFELRGSLMGRLEKTDTAAQAERRERRARKGGLRHKGLQPVPVVTLDSWLAATGQPPPTVVKLDVEGAEIGALRGMSQTLATAKPALLIEMHGTQEGVADVLDAHGYKHGPINADGPTRSAPWWAHIIATWPDPTADAPG